MSLKDMLDRYPVEERWFKRRVTLPIWYLVIAGLLVLAMYGSLLWAKLLLQEAEDFREKDKKELMIELEEAQRLYEITKDACKRQAEICAGAACG